MVAHCILNQNSRAKGIELAPAGLLDGIQELIRRGWGIVQLPCPELIYGLDRNPRPIEHYASPGFIKHCAKLAKQVAAQLRAYTAQGIALEAIVGMDGSPSCGINYVHGLHAKLSGQGIFIQKLLQELFMIGICPELISYQQLIST